MMEKIVELARDAMKKAYSPYSSFSVGACIQGDNGKYYCGCNIESVSFSPTLCAERTAISHAVLDGCRNFKRIAIVNSGENFSWPCGVCRQLLAEFSYDIEVIVVDRFDNLEKAVLKELLPNAFL